MKYYFLLILSLLSTLASGYCKSQLPSFSAARTLQMPKQVKSAPIQAAAIANAPIVAIKQKKAAGGFVIPEGLKLVVGAGGIYAAFLYYGALQEEVFHYKAADGTMFKQAWFLQALGMSFNVIISRSFFIHTKTAFFLIFTMCVNACLPVCFHRGCCQRRYGRSGHGLDWHDP
jgi:hypothetical protein